MLKNDYMPRSVKISEGTKYIIIKVIMIDAAIEKIY